MKCIFLVLFLSIVSFQENNYPDGKSIMEKVDQNNFSKEKIIESQMIIHGRRNSRTVSSKGYSKGKDKTFTEYLSPKREKGTKMLKLEDRLWIYSPSSDRTIQLSGHMLRQSVMGSDLSYEDISENQKYTDAYNAKVLKEDVVIDRKTWVIELLAKTENVTYQKRTIWIDQERYMPLKEELFAKSGELLKRTQVTEVFKIKNKWYPKKTNYKDMLKEGKGTDFIMLNIEVDQTISDNIFSKASLKK